MRVSLITTGLMELKGLPGALRRLFPDHELHAEPLAPGRPFNGLTSSKVLPLSPGDPDGNAVRMLRAALGTLISEDNATPVSDFAIVLDDLELCNRGNEDAVIGHVRESAKRTLRAIGVRGSRSLAEKLMRERISFHLAVPMPESWFFGDFEALRTEVREMHWPPVIDEGVRLLGKIEWPTVLATPTWFLYLRALVRDLEAALGPSPCGLSPGGAEAPRTSLSVLPSDPVLRNL